MRTLLTVLAATATTAGVLALPAQAAAPSVVLQPESLPRGADIAVPHIVDGDFVDGTRRVELPGTVARILGRSGDAWLVGTNNVEVRRNQRVVRVEADGTVRDVLRRVDPGTVVLSEDGSRLVGPSTSTRTATVTVWSATDGTELAAREFDGYPTVLTADDRRVVVQTSRRAVTWRVRPDRVRTVARGFTGVASIEHDLVATYTKDPYLGGCMELVRLSDRTDVVWRSCRERVAAISPDGTQLLTFHILTDGLGPGEIRLRELDGTRLASWSTNWFSGWEWESPGVVLLDVNGTRKSATVRCTVAQCENATDPVRVQAP